MHRVDTPSAVASLPAPGPAGTPGYFTNGDPRVPIQATQPGPDWFNMIQEELAYLCEAFGIELDTTKMNFTQVHEALIRMRDRGTLAALADITVTEDIEAGHRLTWDGEGWVARAPGGVGIDGPTDVPLLQKQILLNSLLDAMAGGTATRVIDSVAEPFANTDGIATNASSNYRHIAESAVINNLRPGLSGDMTLIGSGFEFSVAPRSAHVVAIIETTDSVAYGTDVLIDVSGDRGATWVATSPQKISTTIGGQDVVYAAGVINEIETMVTWRLRCINDKAITLHGLVIGAMPQITAPATAAESEGAGEEEADNS